MTWIIENGGFVNGDVLLTSLKNMNKAVILWDDEFWQTKKYLQFPTDSIFHGSLENAAKLKNLVQWNPGSLCDEKGFSFSYIYNEYNDFLLNQNCIFTSILDVVEKKVDFSIITKNDKKIFARPNSPLKEFSGRVLDSENLTSAHFDYGFYHENINLSIVLSEFKSIEKEFRFVCVKDKIVTGCEYVADGRKGKVLSNPKSDEWLFAQKIADRKKQKDLVYIIDVCESSGNLFLLEMNPFSGADLYVCDCEKIITSVENYIMQG